jgi:hypothetical protein
LKQILKGRLDLGLSEMPIKSDFLEYFDMTNFMSVSEVMFTVCQPRRKPGTFNILRPFG